MRAFHPAVNRRSSKSRRGTLLRTWANAMRFTIRDLLWMTLLAAVAVAWWVERRHQRATIKEQEAEVAYWQEKAVGFAIELERERQASSSAAMQEAGGKFPGSTSKANFGN